MSPRHLKAAAKFLGYDSYEDSAKGGPGDMNHCWSLGKFLAEFDQSDADLIALNRAHDLSLGTITDNQYSMKQKLDETHAFLKRYLQHRSEADE